MNLKSVLDLIPGESAIINGFIDDKFSLKLIEMGCIPGQLIKFKFTAPLGDPICVNVLGYDLSLRLDEAKTIRVI